MAKTKTRCLSMACIRKGLSKPVRLNNTDLQVFLVLVHVFMNKEKSDGMKWLCSAFSILKLNDLIQTNGRQTYEKTGERQGGRRGTRDMTRDPMRWGEDAGTGLQGKGVHELGMNMVHVYWSTEGDTRRISSLQRQWDTVSQMCSFIQMPNAELILEMGEKKRRNNDNRLI